MHASLLLGGTAFLELANAPKLYTALAAVLIGLASLADWHRYMREKVKPVAQKPLTKKAWPVTTSIKNPNEGKPK